MSLKQQYAFSFVGAIIASFGLGWLTLSIAIGLPPISTVSAIGFIMFGLGLAITIKTLSTISKIDLVIEDDDVDDNDKTC